MSDRFAAFQAYLSSLKNRQQTEAQLFARRAAMEANTFKQLGQKVKEYTDKVQRERDQENFSMFAADQTGVYQPADFSTPVTPNEIKLAQIKQQIIDRKNRVQKDIEGLQNVVKSPTGKITDKGYADWQKKQGQVQEQNKALAQNESELQGYKKSPGYGKEIERLKKKQYIKQNPPGSEKDDKARWLLEIEKNRRIMGIKSELSRGATIQEHRKMYIDNIKKAMTDYTDEPSVKMKPYRKKKIEDIFKKYTDYISASTNYDAIINWYTDALQEMQDATSFEPPKEEPTKPVRLRPKPNNDKELMLDFQKGVIDMQQKLKDKDKDKK